MLELLLGTRTKVRLLQLLAESEAPMTRNELAKATNSGIRSTYEQVEELIAIGALKEAGRRVVLEPEFPFYDTLRELLLSSKNYPSTAQDVLGLVDKNCGDKYYIGSFTAARQAITPVDYDPTTYVVRILKKSYPKFYPRIRALGKLPGVEVEVKEKTMTGDAGDVATLVVAACESIPPDVKRVDFLGTQVWMASIERGIVECLAGDTAFTIYGAYLALLLNGMEGAIDLPYLKKLAEDGNSLPHALAAMLEFNDASGRDVFELTENEKAVARKAGGAVDKKEIRHAINTVIGR